MTPSSSDAPETAHRAGGVAWAGLQFAAIAASLALCAHGLHSRAVLEQALWSDPAGAAGVGAVLLALLGALYLAARQWRLPFSMVYAAALVLGASAFAGLGPIAAVLLLLLSAYALGERVLGDTTDAWFGRPLAAIAKVALGCALVSLAVFALALTRFNNPFVYLGLLVLPLVLDWRRLGGSLAATYSEWRGWAATPRPAWAWAASLAVAFAVSMRLIIVLHPETGTDALAMHLVIADQLKETGTFHFNVTQSIWAVMPMAGDWVLATAHMLSGEAGARLANFAADLLLVALVFTGAWRLRSLAAGWLAVVIYATTPLLFRESMTLYIENFWALWCCTGLACGVLSLRADRTRWLWAASLLMGVAFAAKVMTLFYFGAFFVPLAAAWLFADWRRGLRSIALCAAVIALAGAGPYLLAWAKTGNPVFPFYNTLFASPYFDTAADFDNPLFRPGPAWRLLFDATFESQRFLEGRAGAMGVLLFLVSLPTLVGALREGWLIRWALLGSVVFVVTVAHFQSYLRYLLPALPVLAVAMGACLAGVMGHSRTSRAGLLVVLGAGAALNLYLTPASSWSDEGLSMPPFHGSLEWREQRHAGAPGTLAVDLLNDLGTKRVLWFGNPQFGGSHAQVFTTNWHGWATYLQVRDLKDVAGVARWVGRNRIGAVVVNGKPGAAMHAPVEEFLARDTSVVMDQAGVRVYLVDEDVMFADEKLRNPGFDHGSQFWGGEGRVIKGAGTVEVSATRPLSQPVAVTPGVEYLVQVAARCPLESAGYRLQVNWLDAMGAFLNADIEVQPCTEDFEQHSMRVVAPLPARTAMVYASGQDSDAMAEFDRVSFRK